MITPIITDAHTGNHLWRSVDCTEHCGLSARSWSTYISRGFAPKPVAHLDARTPLWDADEVTTWHASRPSQQTSRD